ncbi:MFS transporter [Paenibacillus xerothermodurans]|uniref:MFS transporter n=1 Tax=Paenibacillus xerothermodurans TaxID=1977292 RepID=A0A2W1N943_PAEXE|nr:MFS transporter [Paenibacillus xerothermodurans]PZE20180.1 MFS transporter [Paenibacillus xerothermodurans]
MAALRNLPALIIMLFSMFLLGGISSTKGIILEEVKRDIGLGMDEFGLVVFIFQWGFVLASVITGYYSDKYGLKLMTIIGSLIMGIGLLGTGSAGAVAFFLGFYMVVGFGLGAMTVASNAVVPAVYPKKQGMMFNISMGIYGVGMFLTPIILNAMFAAGISWRWFYVGIAILLVVFILYVVSVKVPEGKVDKINIGAFVTMLRNTQFLFVMLFLVFYVSAEVAFMNFFPSYLQSLNLDEASPAEKSAMVATIISVFSVLFTLGRLAGGFITGYIGEKRTLILFSLLALIVVTLSKYFANEWIYMFAAAGLFFSVLFPTATGLGTKLSETGGSALGLVYVAAGIGGAFAGWIVGAVSEAFGPEKGFNLPIIFLAILFVISLVLKDKPDADAVQLNSKATK